MSKLLGSVLILIAVAVAGIIAGARLFPQVREIQVAKEILKAVPVPGETKVITVRVPGPVQKVEVPVEVTRFIDRPGKERIVTVTREIQVPVDVVRREFPQTITVTVGSVLSDKDEWVTPKFKELLIGQVRPGAYAVPTQPGWKIDEVKTETRLTPEVSRWSLEFRPTLGIAKLGPTTAVLGGVEIVASKDNLVFTAAGGYSSAGPWGLAFFSYRF